MDTLTHKDPVHVGLIRAFALAAILILVVAPPLAASEAARLLDCADASALLGDWSTLGRALSADAECREHHYSSGNEFECRGRSTISAYGIPMQEFILRDSAGGTRELRGVFKSGVGALRAAAERRHHASFVQQDASAWRAELGDGRALRLDQREDGASELACIASGALAADARRAGADSDHGAVSGRLAFPSAPLPPMRVCAIPADLGSDAGGWCTLTGEGEWSFLIGEVPPGEYVVLAWPTRDNPNHYIIGHGAALQDCLPNEVLCAGGSLTRVYVHAGEVLRSIDVVQSFTDLPSRFMNQPAAR